MQKNSGLTLCYYVHFQGLYAAEPPRCPCPSGLCGVTWTLPPTVTMAGDGDFQRRGESGGCVGGGEPVGDAAVDIRCALYFPLLDKLVEIDTNKVVR